MSFEAKIIADSISPEGIRLRTFQLRYPRFIHAEFMTHRKFSRNASSSRAIPVRKIIESIQKDPAMPIFWGSNQPGMQAGEELTGRAREQAEREWKWAMKHAIDAAEEMIEYGLHKQIANRILEPWSHISVVCTATDYDNFYALRRHKDAQPEMKHLADLMWEAEQASTPQRLLPGEWHLPYIDLDADLGNLLDHVEGANQAEAQANAVEIAKKVSVARCARVSYLTHDGRRSTVLEDLALYERLLGSQPMHASPAEHQATPMENLNNGTSNYEEPVFRESHLGGNFTGWIQYRKTLPNEAVQG